MHDLNNIENLARQNQQQSAHRLEIAAGLYAANRVNDHMRQVEAQNDAMLHQMWVQTELMSGRSMHDIQNQLNAEAAQAQSASWENFIAGLFITVSLVAGATVFVMTGYNGWLSIITIVLTFVGLCGIREKEQQKRRPEATERSEGNPSSSNIGGGDHSQWVEDFRTRQAHKLRVQPRRKNVVS
jgi:hypothetical protein